MPTLLRIDLDVQSVIFSIGLLALLWSFFLLTHKRGNLMANKFLALLLTVLASFIIRRTANVENESIPLFIYFLSHGFIYLIGPAIYFHIAYLIKDQKAINRLWLHFLPAMLAVSLMAVLFFLRTEIDKVEDFSTLRTASILFISTQVIHVLIYLFLTRKLVSNYTKRCESFIATRSQINLNWTQHLVLITTILGGSILALHILIISGGYYDINNTVDTLFLFLLTLIILNLLYKSWRQPEIISGLSDESGKYKTSKLTNAESQQLKERLDQLTLQEQIFLTPELNIAQVAALLNTQPYLLSQLLNDTYKENFFHFINRHRITYATKRIDEGALQKMTLEAIAYEAGFNSKSTFNRAFRKQMRCTPKEYHRSIRKISA